MYGNKDVLRVKEKKERKKRVAHVSVAPPPPPVRLLSVPFRVRELGSEWQAAWF